MGVGVREFRVYSWKKVFFRTAVVVMYLAFVVSFLKIGLQPSETGAISGDELSIPSISLETFTETVMLDGNKFPVPDRAVGAYYAGENKIFLMGHKTSIFADLDKINYGDEITFGGDKYIVRSVAIMAKEDIDMSGILASEPEKTLVLMTCYGKQLSATDYTHRLIITAK